MEFPITEMLHIKTTCNRCRGNKVLTGEAGNVTPCSACSGTGDVYIAEGSFLDLARRFGYEKIVLQR